MGRDGWFRNTFWTAEIEDNFNQRLKRARNKTQPLRIQAHALADTQPDAALRLIERYFEHGGDLDIAGAHCARATAYLAMNNVDGAVSAYEAVLQREAEFPNVKTRAFLDLPKLIAERRIARHYERALDILEEHASQLVFPVDRYTWAGSKAIILHELGKNAEAKALAKQATEAASTMHSGFRYHPRVGLVGPIADWFGARIVEISGGGQADNFY